MGGRANNHGVESTMPPDKPSRRVDMIDLDDVAKRVEAGEKVSLCRCYASKKFPYCDGSHVKHNAETGDNAAPLVITKDLPAEQRGLSFVTQISEEELKKEAKGPRANNYGVASTMPPDNPTKCVHMIDVEDMQKATAGGGACAVCRCFKSKTFPMCDGSHNSHNVETGDNAGPAVVKPMAPPPPPEAKAGAKRANNYGIPSTMPPEKPTKRVDVLDVEAIAARVAAGENVSLCRCFASKNFPYCDGSHVKHNAETGDNAAPLVITKDLPADKRGLKFSTQISEEELKKEVKGPRANNYGVASTMPPGNPTKVVHMLDIEDLKNATANGAACSLCRCYKSKTFPLCDGSHISHNEETGDNAAPAVLKQLGGAPPPPPAKVEDAHLKMISLKEVQQHDKEGDAWVIIHGKVYDVSEFLPLHPGGQAVLQQFAGKVADEAFDGVHDDSVLLNNLSKDKLLGQVSAEEAVAQDAVVFEAPPIESILNTYDLEQVAQASMRDSAFGYWFTGATDEFTKWGNQDIYRRIRLVPRVMRDVSSISMETSMLGHKMSFPVYISAAAKGGLGHPDAEEALCRAAHTTQTIQMCPHMGTKTLEQMAKARAPGQIQFLQLYVETDRAASEETVKLANELGFSGLFLTVDSAGIGKRETDLRLTPGGSAPRSAATKRRWAADLTWADVPWFRQRTAMPIVLKGVQSAADAVAAYEHGLDGIVISNHGGRNMDTARPALEVLIEVMPALRAANYDPAKFEVYVDGGVRRGSDVFKALALGARAVGIGRAALYGLAAYGQAGVEKCLEILQDELFTTMQMMGAPTLADIVPDMLKGVEHVEAWSWATSRDHNTRLKL